MRNFLHLFLEKRVIVYYNKENEINECKDKKIDADIKQSSSQTSDYLLYLYHLTFGEKSI